MNFQTFAEINLNHLVLNLKGIQKKVSPAHVIPVVKADAYGHGAVAVTRCLVKEGVKIVAVARFQEAMELRESGLTLPILIFGRLFPGEIPQAIKSDFRITLFGKEDIRWIEKAGQPEQARVHVNLETGMGRTGVFLDQEPDFFDRLICSTHCIWEGLYTHFSTSDEVEKSYARRQLSRFQTILSRLQKNGSRPSLVHMANSGAILDIPESYFDAVRPGILLYGHYPSSLTSRSVQIRQVMTLKSFVAHIRKIPAGHPVSYGRRWIAKRATSIAVLPIGYADGIRRDLSNAGQVLIQGKHYPMVGTVTMDAIMVDVGKDAITPGDEVVIWGHSPRETVQVLDIADKIGTIPYELTCGVSKRVKRVYVGEK